MPNEAATRHANVTQREPLSVEAKSFVTEIANLSIMIGGKMHLIGAYFDVAVKDDGDVHIFGKDGRMDRVTATALVLHILNVSKRRVATGWSKQKDGTHYVLVREA